MQRVFLAILEKMFKVFVNEGGIVYIILKGLLKVDNSLKGYKAFTIAIVPTWLVQK